ncbi:beta-lactamase domain protein [Desulfatibacillum aliphaticivorans]|uniref:Beta-lactamase domain protein n=1 Tax=Desulfatibacillum aliphaticivorans TaxID=218208 RepID=B8FKM3_DESAL|nr:alkyl sulfatase dimerization domain-containing protein [Desulfatibacillum aliphaticivorans]ACL01838.1 beta-lactamase domain protein [Desulfatibacillum aliphaticivorans]
MKKVLLVFVVLLLVCAGGVGLFVKLRSQPAMEKKTIANVQAAGSLKEHTKHFERKVYKVADNIYSAVGFGLANSIMIEGDDGLIIVDTMESLQEAREVLAEFRKISDKPIKAIIYTHNHTDHIFGAQAFAEGGEPEVYAHENLGYYVNRLVSKMKPIIGNRSMRMFGNFLDQEGLENDGIGPFLGIGPDRELGYIPPTQTFRDKMDVEVAGVKMELIYAPGETNDTIYVWLKGPRILMTGDNLYRSFPNLYTIRGTPYRSVKSWYQSVDIIRDLKPEIMVPSHGQPIFGAEKVYSIATDYRDAIQYVHDQGIRCVNMGMTPDQIVEQVHLPPHLAASPYLQEYYGKVSWSLRSLFDGNLGWFDGDSATLQPLSQKDNAQLMADLAGGKDKLQKEAQARFDNGQYQAALQLTGYVIALDPQNPDARGLRSQALIKMGEREENANARHYYLTEALEIRDDFVASTGDVKSSPEMVHRFPIEGFFELMAVGLDPVKSADLDMKVSIRFTDVGKDFTIHVRRGVAEIQPRLLDNPDILVKVDSKIWKEMLSGLRNPVTTMAGFDYEKGGTIAFAKFMKMFKTPAPKLAFEPAA